MKFKLFVYVLSLLLVGNLAYAQLHMQQHDLHDHDAHSKQVLELCQDQSHHQGALALGPHWQLSTASTLLAYQASEHDYALLSLITAYHSRAPPVTA